MCLTMLVPLSWLKQYVDVAIPTAELAERLSLAGLEVEAIETVGDDEVLNIAITPDAARCLSIIGVAREVAAITSTSIKLPPDELPASGSDQADAYASVRIDDPGKCARYIGMVITGVKVGPSPQWMQDRLSKAGVRPVNNVVDVTNYVMLEWGQPLHAFDFARLKNRAGEGAKPQVIVRAARGGEKMKTLDGGDRTLDDSMLVIADSAGPIAVAGVMGGADSEVSLGTTDIFLESACFDRTTVRRGAQKLKMATEASYRFTRGVPAELSLVAAKRAAKLLVEVAGGRIVPGMIDQYPVPQEKLAVYLTASQVRRTLGVKISIEQIAEILQRLEFQVEHLSSASPIPRDSESRTSVVHRAGRNRFEMRRALVPIDVRIPADLTEEVARMIGFDSIATTQMSEPLPHPTANLLNEAEEKIRDVLIGCGLQETINYTLTTPQKHELLGVGGEQTKYVALANPMSVDRTVMRRSMLVSAVENLAYNVRFAERIAAFEVGRVYLPELSEDGIRPLEDRRVSILLSGPRRETNINADAVGTEPFDFFDLKGIVEALLNRLGVAAQKIQYLPHSQPQTFTPRCAQIMVGEQVVGTFGELNPATLAKFDTKASRVAVAELKIGPLIRGDWDWSRVTTVNSMPMVIEDLAFVVADAVGAGRVQETMRRAGGGKVVAIDLFDVFRGESLGAGKKSLAFRVSYQAPDAALSNEQVIALRNGIVQAVSIEHGGVLRTT